MINLIPQAGKDVVRREYFLRVGTVFGFLCAGALVAGGLLLLPTYALVTRQLHSVIVAGVEEKDAEADYARQVSELDEAEKIAGQLLVSGGRSASASSILTHIEASISPEVVLTNLSVTETKEGAAVTARGTATTRESLRRFVEGLKRDAFFADAVVPVSDLARDTNLSFTVTLTLRTESGT